MKKILYVLGLLLLLPTVLAGNEYGKITSGKDLLITDVDIRVDGLTSRNLEYSDSISRVAKPESEVIFEIQIKNNNSGTDMEDIEMLIQIEELDLEEFVTLNTLDAGDDKTLDATMTLPFDIEEQDYEIFIEVEAELNVTINKVEFLLDLEVEVDSGSSTSSSSSSSGSSVLNAIKTLNDSVNNLNLDYYDLYTACNNNLDAKKTELETKGSELGTLEATKTSLSSCQTAKSEKESRVDELEVDVLNCNINMTQLGADLQDSEESKFYWAGGVAIIMGIAFAAYIRKKNPATPAHSEQK